MLLARVTWLRAPSARPGDAVSTGFTVGMSLLLGALERHLQRTGPPQGLDTTVERPEHDDPLRVAEVLVVQSEVSPRSVVADIPGPGAVDYLRLLRKNAVSLSKGMTLTRS